MTADWGEGSDVLQCKKGYAGLGVSELGRLRQLDEERGCLKRLVGGSAAGQADPARGARKKGLKPARQAGAGQVDA